MFILNHYTIKILCIKRYINHLKKTCQVRWDFRTIADYFLHLDSELSFDLIVSFQVFMNRYRQYEEDTDNRALKFELVQNFRSYDCLKLAKN